METIKKIRRATRSKTIKWGHVQMIGGAITAALGVFNPALFPNLPLWVFGAAGMVAAVITYLLRSVTRTPLDDK